MNRFYGGLLVFICVLLTLQNSIAQQPTIRQWDYRFGSASEELVEATKQTLDSGFILIGTTYPCSNGGDITDPCRGASDIWVVKTDKNGIKEWDKRYGGGGTDYAQNGIQLNDSGFIFTGFSYSNISGEKSQDNWDTTLTSPDAWVVRVDANGNKLWDRRFGGVSTEALSIIIKTADGNFLLGGTSNSALSGDLTQGTNGGEDFYVIKIDINGNKLWDYNYGGTGQERLTNILQTNDGGYMISGLSYSNAGGDKTENNRDTTMFPSADYWVLKLDSIGIKDWDKTYGGSNDDYGRFIIPFNGHYIFGGISKSQINGDKTIANHDTTTGFYATFDFWFVEFDSLGNKTGEKLFGGSSHDELINIAVLNDGSFLLSGDSYSPASFEKSENNFGGPEETWIVKTDSAFNIEWDKTIFTVSPQQDDENGTGIITFEGCLVVTNQTWAGIGGYKTQSGWGSNDYWIVKLCDSSVITNIIQTHNLNVVSISPNPTASSFTITSPDSYRDQHPTTLTLYDITGRTLLQQSFNTTATIDISDLTNGIYIAEIKDKEGSRVAGKVVKE